MDTTCGTGFSNRVFGQPNTIDSGVSLFEDVDGTAIRQRSLGVFIDSPVAITTGQQYNLAAPPANTQVNADYDEFRGSNNTALSWRANSGVVTVTSISSSSITLTLSGVNYSARSGGAAGSFTVDGSFTVPRQ